jgi:hypothetical protein
MDQVSSLKRGRVYRKGGRRVMSYLLDVIGERQKAES